MVLRRFSLGVVLVLASGLGGLGCSESSSKKVIPPPAPTSTPSATGVGSNFWYVGDTFGNPLKTHNGTEAALAQDVFDRVNILRAAEMPPLPALVRDVEADRAAKAHSEDMLGRGFFSHLTPEGWNPGDRLAMLGASGFSGWGENIAAGQTTAADVMTAWINSSGHLANMLDPNWTHIGVGVAEGPQRQWTQVFLRRP